MIPEHLIVQHIVGRLSPRDQWSVACCSKGVYKEFLDLYPEFIKRCDWEENVVRELFELEKALKRRRRCRSISFFNISKMETLTLKSGGIYIFERKKGGRFWEHVEKDGVAVFRECVMPEIRRGRVKVMVEATDRREKIFDRLFKLFSD